MHTSHEVESDGISDIENRIYTYISSMRMNDAIEDERQCYIRSKAQDFRVKFLKS